MKNCIRWKGYVARFKKMQKIFGGTEIWWLIIIALNYYVWKIVQSS